MSHSREEHVRMMKDPELWPIWPILPLIHDKDRKEAFMHNGNLEGLSAPKICLGNMFFRRKDAVVVKFNSHEEIYDAGWRVD